jgi:DNA modification methylase
MQKNKYQTIIIDVEQDKFDEDVNELISNSSESSNFFFLTRNLHDESGFIYKSAFDYIENLTTRGLNYINTVIVPLKTVSSVFNDNTIHLIWMVKNLDKMKFNKDNIREKHIWKDVEWGKREKNYNPKGKDPGNFWLPTVDDGKGKITGHILLTFEDIIDRVVKSTTESGDIVYIQSSKQINFKQLESELKIKIIYKESKSFINNGHFSSNSKQGKTVSKSLKSKVIFKSSEYMKDLKDGSIDLMVTSPPYWDLKNYFKKGQIGQESYLEYLERMGKVWEETFRVLDLNGSMWININTRTKNKKPILIPQDIIKQCSKIGFKLKHIIIWHKSSGIPTGKNNLVDHYEYFLWFVKSKDHYFNQQYFQEINDYKNENLAGGLTWNINRKAGSVGKDFIHPAIYPTELIERIIKMCSVENALVLDPFLGSGTTLIAAKNTKRECIGYEFNEGFEQLIRYRLKEERIEANEIEFLKDRSIESEIFRK